MGVHMGPSAAQLPLGKDRKEVPAAAPPLVPEMATKNEMLGVFVDISKVMGNALVTSSKTVHDSAMNVIVHEDCATGCCCYGCGDCGGDAADSAERGVFLTHLFATIKTREIRTRSAFLHTGPIYMMLSTLYLAVCDVIQ